MTAHRFGMGFSSVGTPPCWAGFRRVHGWQPNPTGSFRAFTTVAAPQPHVAADALPPSARRPAWRPPMPRQPLTVRTRNVVEGVEDNWARHAPTRVIQQLLCLQAGPKHGPVGLAL